MALFLKYERLQDLEWVLRLRSNIEQSTSRVDPKLAYMQSVLAILHKERYARLEELEDLCAALQYDKAALDYTPPDHPDLASRQALLAGSYSDCYERLGMIDDLEAALKYNTAALDNTSSDHPDLADRQAALALSYSDCYRRFGKVDDLEAALKYKQAALDNTHLEHPKLADRQAALAVSYSDCHQRFGKLDDLEAALKYNKLALDNTPLEHPQLADRQVGLAFSYSDCYQRWGKLDDLETALKYNKSALDNTPLEHPQLADRQAALAASYLDCYQRLGKLDDLEASLKYDKAALDNTPLDHPGLADRQAALAVSYSDCYRRLGKLDDLEAALKYKQAALNNTPPDHRKLADRQAALAVSYSDSYRRSGKLDDLEAALKYDKAALNNTPFEHPKLADRQAALAASYSDCYGRLEKLDDLQAALKHGQAALDNTPLDHSDLADRQAALGVSYLDSYQKLEKLDDLEAALKYNQTSLNNTSSDHPKLADRYYNLAISFIYCYKHDMNQDYYQSALSSLNMILDGSNVLPSIVWSAAILLASFTITEDSSVALNAYKKAFAILPDLISIALPLPVRYHYIKTHTLASTTCSAVALAVQSTHFALAVQFVEQGLSVIHQQLWKLRDEYIKLSNQYPKKACDLKLLSTLFTQKRHLSGKYDDNFFVFLLQSEATRYKQLIAEIRSYDGFHSFLHSSDYLELSYAAQDGPVIVLNCTNIQSNALIILYPEYPPISVNLKFSENDANHQMNGLRSALRQYSIKARNTDRTGRLAPEFTSDNQFTTVISWLWKFVVEPVFLELQKNNIHAGRIWWCTSGPLTYLPIHAAAPVESPYIQSYTTTLSGLIQARKQISQKTCNTCAIIGVSRPLDLFFKSLPFVSKEVAIVQSLLTSYQPVQLLDSHATVDKVSQEMQNASWLHLACHGQQNYDDPLKSSLVLYDGQLELEKIISSNLPNAKFVFLSACETAMGDANLINEAMHLTGGFITAGFLGAIGTLWSMSDFVGPIVAEKVYAKVCEKQNEPEVTLAAEGLHLAICELRKQGVSYEKWMSFVHFGI